MPRASHAGKDCGCSGMVRALELIGSGSYGRGLALSLELRFHALEREVHLLKHLLGRDAELT